MLLFVLPFTLVDDLGIKMVPLMTLISILYMGEESSNHCELTTRD